MIRTTWNDLLTEILGPFLYLFTNRGIELKRLYHSKQSGSNADDAKTA
jgi:hypothetical protein